MELKYVWASNYFWANYYEYSANIAYCNYTIKRCFTDQLEMDI